MRHVGKILVGAALGAALAIGCQVFAHGGYTSPPPTQNSNSLRTFGGGVEYSTATAAGAHKTATATLTASQMRNLRATPITAIAGVVGSVIVPISGVVYYTHVANPYDSVGGGLAFRYTDGSGGKAATDINVSSFLDIGSAANDMATIVQSAGSVEPVTGAAIVLHNTDGSEWSNTDNDSDGDGTLLVVINYDEYVVP